MTDCFSLIDAIADGTPFHTRHIGPNDSEIATMLRELRCNSLDELVDQTVPRPIRLKKLLELPAQMSEEAALAKLRRWAAENSVWRSYIGTGYADCFVPPVIQRNIFENPGWYTQYTPYQAEISQGRLEALFNFQTMVAELTGLPVAGASLLDEATAAAEAMILCRGAKKPHAADCFFVADDCHPQTIAVLKTRAEPLGIEIRIGDPKTVDFADAPFGLLLQYPSTHGVVTDHSKLVAKTKSAGSMTVLACDLLALVLLKSPGELGADVAVGNAQRFGVPLGYGGPHAAFLATKEEHKRRLPGRIIGLSKDAAGKPAYRMALQTREQHIRRDKATSNICTAQVLLAIMSGMYAVYHGPDGLTKIARRVHALTVLLASRIESAGLKLLSGSYFDTLQIHGTEETVNAILKRAAEKHVNLRHLNAGSLGVTLDERTTLADLTDLVEIFTGETAAGINEWVTGLSSRISDDLRRTSEFLTHPVFNTHHSETELMRYIRKLESRDLSLTRSMIPLGSCTMKLNAAVELMPVSWPEFANLHPFAPLDQSRGYQKLFTELEALLAECTGFDRISLQPNSGAQGEYAGLLAIRAYHLSRGDTQRDVCLIPKSAHGTNPASAVMAGMKVVVVECDQQGNVDLGDLQRLADQHADRVGALMITYPSTHGVFEEGVIQACEIVHSHGGQVYMDGANMNAQVGLCRPGDFGPDVCHLNLHKTFCIPHGGGGPGMGPIGVKSHLASFLPSHPVINPQGDEYAVGPVSAAPWGSASILPISLMYIWMMGADGLKKATQVAILNANHIAHRLDSHFPVLYRGTGGRVGHECIVDLRPLKGSAGVEVEDVAKRLMDYGFHAPTVSFPVPGTLMIEPTESESLDELNRFCDAMIAIRDEIREIERGEADRDDNLLQNAPHTADAAIVTEWTRPYSRERAVFPTAAVRESKFWPSVSRIDAAFGDRNLICTCPPIEAFAEEVESTAASRRGLAEQAV